MRSVAAALLCVALHVVESSVVFADSAVIADDDLPRVSPLSWTARDGTWTQSAILDFTAIAVLGAGREAGYPELGRLRGGEPEALRLHVGAFGDFGRLAYLVRVDISETLRIISDDLRLRPLAASNRLIDSSYGVVRLSKQARLLIGRQPVAVSRFHEVPTSLLATGAAPFVVDRVFPARRWGARAKLSRGDSDASVGAWADGDSFEPRIVPGDPSVGQRAAITAGYAHRLTGLRGRHWLAEDHLGVRGHLIARFGQRTRLDGVVGLEASRGLFAGALELLGSVESGAGHVGVAAEISALWHPRSATFIRGELDGERDIYATGAGISYFATKDRRSRLAFYAWLRRDRFGTAERDGVIMQLQSEL